MNAILGSFHKMCILLFLCIFNTYFFTTLSSHPRIIFESPADYMHPLYAHKKVENGLRLGVMHEYMPTVYAYDMHGKKTSFLQSYASHESLINAFSGVHPHSPLHAIANKYRFIANDLQGLYETTAEASAYCSHVSLSYTLPSPLGKGALEVSGGIPVAFIRITNQQWSPFSEKREAFAATDKTIHADALKRFLESENNELEKICYVYGKQLSIKAHQEEKPVIGNPYIQLAWHSVVRQYAARLTRVLTSLRVGFTLPLAPAPSINQPFTPDYGYEGTAGALLAGNLQLDLQEGVGIGLEVRAHFLAPKKQEWRIKNHSSQTDGFLFEKAIGTKEFGPEWRFYLFSGYNPENSGVALKVGYEFLKQSYSNLYLDSSAYMKAANTAQTLESNQRHYILGSLSYTARSATHVIPMVDFFVRVPFAGKRACVGGSVGLNFSLRF